MSMCDDIFFTCFNKMSINVYINLHGVTTKNTVLCPLLFNLFTTNCLVILKNGIDAK